MGASLSPAAAHAQLVHKYMYYDPDSRIQTERGGGVFGVRACLVWGRVRRSVHLMVASVHVFRGERAGVFLYSSQRRSAPFFDIDATPRRGVVVLRRRASEDTRSDCFRGGPETRVEWNIPQGPISRSSAGEPGKNIRLVKL